MLQMIFWYCFILVGLHGLVVKHVDCKTWSLFKPQPLHKSEGKVLLTQSQVTFPLGAQGFTLLCLTICLTYVKHCWKGLNAYKTGYSVIEFLLGPKIKNLFCHWEPLITTCVQCCSVIGHQLVNHAPNQIC